MTGECREAILLVGGKGTRLRPLTLTVPKPMLPTAGVPFVAHQLARLRAAGVRRVVLATCYHAAAFERYFGTGAEYGLELVYETEDEPLGTGGAARGAAEHLLGGADEPILVLNGDVLSGHDLVGQLRQHQQQQALPQGRRPSVTLHLTEVTDSRKFGCVPVDEHGRVTAFHEKSADPVTRRVNAGAYVFTREAISRIPAGRGVSLEHHVFPAALGEGQVLMGYTDLAYWLDVGTPAAYVRGSADLVLGRLTSPALALDPAGSRSLTGPPSAAGWGASLLAESVNVAPDAVVDGGATIGEGARIGPGARVSGSILFDEATVEGGAVVRDSVLARGARVGAGAVLDGAVAGDGAVIGAHNELRAGLRLWPGMELPTGAIRFSSDV